MGEMYYPKFSYHRRRAAAQTSGSYLSAVMKNSPAGYWRLGEASGNALDASGHGNDGTVYTGVTQGVTGLILNDPDAAASFDQSNNSTGIEVPNSASLQITGAITLEAWMKHSSSNFSGGIVWKSEPLFSGLETQKVYELGFLSGTLYFQISNGTTQNSLSYNFTGQTSGVKHFITATWDGTTGANGVKIFIDGVQVAQGTSAIAAIQSTLTSLKIGGKHTSANSYEHFPGTLDEVAVYGAVSSLAQHTERYNIGH
jgi:hypothetical protein